MKDGKAVNVFGYDDDGKPIEVPWSRSGSSDILANGWIDGMGGGFTIYKIANDGCSVTEIAAQEPYDYPDMASLGLAKWRYYIYGKQVDSDYYVKYLEDRGYVFHEKHELADIKWIEIKNI